jgi:hypothetical protein
MAHGNMDETMSFHDAPCAGAAGTPVAALFSNSLIVGAGVLLGYIVRIVVKPRSSYPVTVLGPLSEEPVGKACGDEV